MNFVCASLDPSIFSRRQSEAVSNLPDFSAVAASVQCRMGRRGWRGWREREAVLSGDTALRAGHAVSQQLQAIHQVQMDNAKNKCSACCFLCALAPPYLAVQQQALLLFRFVLIIFILQPDTDFLDIVRLQRLRTEILLSRLATKIGIKGYQVLFSTETDKIYIF